MSEQVSDNLNPYNKSVQELSDGLLKYYKEPLEEVQEHVKELTLEQNKVIIQLHDENMALAEHFFSPELQDMIKKMNLYYGKLLSIKKGMKQLHERSGRLKMRAMKMEQFTEKMRLKKLQKEIDLKKEEELIGQGPSTSIEKNKSDLVL